MFPSSWVSIHSLDLRASTYQRTSQKKPSGNISMARSTWEPLSHTQDRLYANHGNWLSAILFLNFPVLFSLLSPTVFYLNHAGVLILPSNTWSLLATKFWVQGEKKSKWTHLRLGKLFTCNLGVFKFSHQILSPPVPRLSAGVPGEDTAAALAAWKRGERSQHRGVRRGGIGKKGALSQGEGVLLGRAMSHLWAERRVKVCQ